jgi:hypothetical protein
MGELREASSKPFLISKLIGALSGFGLVVEMLNN